jgi:hypothetical protein
MVPWDRGILLLICTVNKTPNKSIYRFHRAEEFYNLFKLYIKYLKKLYINSMGLNNL